MNHPFVLPIDIMHDCKFYHVHEKLIQSSIKIDELAIVTDELQ